LLRGIMLGYYQEGGGGTHTLLERKR
jgi:hypothetical protein